MSKAKGFVLAASMVLAMAFTFSCSGDDVGGGDPSSSNNGGGDPFSFSVGEHTPSYNELPTENFFPKFPQ